MGMVVLTASLVVFVWAVVGLIRPPWARLPSRMASVGVWLLSIVLFIIGGALMPDSTPEQTEQSAAGSQSVPPPTPEATPAPAPDDGDWRTNRTTNALDDSPTVTAILDAAQGVGGFGSDPIQLVARCQSNQTDVYINWRDFLGDDTLGVSAEQKRVTYRFPPVEATTELWSISTDNESTFVAQPIPFLRTLVASDQLILQTTPYGESPSLATFELTGARAAIDPIAETCSWTLPTGE